MTALSEFDLRQVHLCAGETIDGYYQPLEKAEMVRTGSDVTILCYSRMRYVVMQAVAELEKQGYDPEVHSNHHPLRLRCTYTIYECPYPVHVVLGTRWSTVYRFCT